MIRLANSAYQDNQKNTNERPACMVYRMLLCSVVVTGLTCAHPGVSLAASQLNVKVTPSRQAITIGQQQTGLPLKLHGVFEAFNPETRRLRLTHFTGMEVFWGDAMRNIEVERSVDVNALEPGMSVTAILARRFNGQYVVTGLVRS